MGSTRTESLALVLIICVCCRDSSAPEVGSIPTRLTLISGISATGYVAGVQIPTPIVLQLTDGRNRPVPQIQLAIRGNDQGGGVSPNPVTDANGIARFLWTPGIYVGVDTLEIYVEGSALTPVDIVTTTIPGSLVNLFLKPPAATIAVGTTLRINAMASDTHFNTISGTPLSWTSSNPSTVSVSAAGIVTALAAGTAIITASSGPSATTMVAVPAPAGPGGPAIPPFTIAITAAKDPTVQIMSSDGSLISTVTCGSQCDFVGGPNWSPDGSQLAMQGRRGSLSVLFVANADGTNLHEVASAPSYVVNATKSSILFWPQFDEAWSTDGRLAYVRQTASGNAIEMVNADGSGHAVVMPLTAPGPSYLGWGLGNTMITALISTQLYGMSPDGSNLRLLTPISGIGSPTWSPDGNSVAFVRFLGTTPNLAVLDPVSGTMHAFTTPRAGEFCWSPNSGQLAVVSQDNQPQNWQSIYTINADGTGAQQVVTAILDSFNPVLPAWSPDSRFIVYTDDRTLSGGTAGPQIYAEGLVDKTNTRLNDVRNVVDFDIAQARGCERPLFVPAP